MDVDMNDSYDLSGPQVKCINSLLRSVGMYPLSMIRTLIQVLPTIKVPNKFQLGYEPLPPTLGKSWTGRPQLYLPNFLKYGIFTPKFSPFNIIFQHFQVLTFVLLMGFLVFIVDFSLCNFLYSFQYQSLVLVMK